MLHRTSRSLRPVAGLALLVTLSACGPVEDEREIPKPAIRMVDPARFDKVDTLNRLALTQDPHGSAHGGGMHGAAAIEFDYDKPDHWQVESPTQFRLVNLRIPPAGGQGDPGECYLSLLPARADAEFAFIQRWAKQMGQQITRDAVAKLPTKKLFGRDARFVEFHGTFTGMGGAGKPDYSLLALMLPAPGQIVTLKMFGPRQLVAAERDNFDKFIASLRPKDTGSGSGTAAEDGPTGRLVWKLPTGWREGAARPMREATLHPNPGDQTECTLIFLSGTAGGRDANIRRWAAQMSAKQPTGDEIDRMPQIQVLGQTVTFAELEGNYTGMNAEKVAKAVMFGVVCPLGSRTLFIKMVGPVDEMTAARQGFLELCRSLKLEGGK